MSTLEAKNVVKQYEGSSEIAVKGINFRIEDGEFVAILGPSGCGKSSTLRMIAGLEDITKGEILFDDKVVNNMSPAQRNIALAFESYALYSPLNVYENIAFSLRAAKVGKEEIDRRVREVCEMFDLTAIMKKKPSAISGGQQQRVSLARALVRKPNIFLLDEPLSHVDQRTRADIRARIKFMHDREKITTIYVTHDQEEAVSLADRVLVMNYGEIQQFGSIDDLWNRPANLFVAGFIGEPAINLIEGTLDGDSVHIGSVRWELGRKPKTGPGKVMVGFRPNKIDVSVSPAENGLEGIVTVQEFMGTEKLLTISINGEDFRALIPVHKGVETGKPVYLKVAPQNVSVFDMETGIALQ